jgi:disulfide bond formation protein DsbB
MRLAPGALAIACFGVLAFALTMQYGFGIEPCVLCAYQRIAYGAAGNPRPWPHSRPRPATAARRSAGLCGLVLLVGFGIALYHVGVEQHCGARLSARPSRMPPSAP